METNTAVAALAALAQQNRLDVFRLLVQTGATGLPAGRSLPRAGLRAALRHDRAASSAPAGAALEGGGK